MTSHEITSGFVNSYDYCNPREVPHITRNGRPAYNSRNMSETFHTPSFGEDFEILPITPPRMPGEGATPGMNPASAVGYPEHTAAGGGGGGGGTEPTFHTAGSPQQMSSLTSPLNPQQATNVPSPRTSTNSPVLSQAQSPALSHTMSPAGTYTTSLSNVTPSYSSQSSPVFSDQLSHMTESLPVATSAQAPVNPQFPPQMFDVPPITDAACSMGHFNSGMDPVMAASLGSSMSGATTHMSPSYHMSHPQQPGQHHPHPGQQQQQPHHPHHPQQAHHPQDSSNFFHHGHTEMGPPHPPGPQHLSTINHSQLGLGLHHGGLPPMSQQHHAQLMAGQTASPPHMVAGRAGHLESSEDSDDNTPLAQFAAQAKRPEVVKETKKKPPKRKRKKDPNEPQKPVSAYALFFRDTQAAIKGQNPNASFGEVSKIVASMWDSLDAEQKAAYKQRTETAKKEYLKKLAAYRASLVSKAAVDQMDPEEQSPSKQQRLSGPVSVSPPHGANVAGVVGQHHPSVAPRVIAPKPPSSSNAPVGGGTMTTAASPYGQPAAMVQPMQNVQRVVKPMGRFHWVGGDEQCKLRNGASFGQIGCPDPLRASYGWYHGQHPPGRQMDMPYAHM
ncbi:thymocyte selection-associated high mobility group box protein TOX-like isoform X2 [Lytechinus variegatus]|uniref:thymocyte selection-associated high mobility group box protein TOX-like isoform X2 n=1 Tax=Lytechinus variegatus TaxID=7654 RepID=UPI001BB2B843|nr:thymocyte selection-associated high mobility group box protein TOX-like isoform X2 [Lytechinus variegatus]